MAKYSGFRGGITPSGGVANWVLETVANVEAKVIEVGWGGEVTTSTAMRTRIARDSAVGTGARTAGDTQKGNQHSPANAAFFSTTYATTQPTIVAGALYGTSWNAHGGVIRWLAAPGEEFFIYDAAAANASLECRADTGTAASSYSLVWEET
jgi:hypothetical protein